jgi:hypothetical protein
MSEHNVSLLGKFLGFGGHTCGLSKNVSNRHLCNEHIGRSAGWQCTRHCRSWASGLCAHVEGHQINRGRYECGAYALLFFSLMSAVQMGGEAGLGVMQFVPQYSTYTCYQDVEDDQVSPAPSGQYRHATYVIRDPFQEQAIAQSRAQSQVCLSPALGHFRSAHVATHIMNFGCSSALAWCLWMCCCVVLRFGGAYGGVLVLCSGGLLFSRSLGPSSGCSML